MDGGIYDNFGLLAAMDWLDDALMGSRQEQAVALVRSAHRQAERSRPWSTSTSICG